jgi:hypothetical protein
MGPRASGDAWPSADFGFEDPDNAIIGKQHQFPEVAIVDSEVLEVAARAGQRAVRLWGGESSVGEAFAFRMALDLPSWPESEIDSPELGGFHIPDVMIHIGWQSWLTSTAEFEQDMTTHILNVLRLCRLKGHDEIVFGAWGCDGGTECAEVIANLFYDALLGKSGVAGSCRTITFAMSRASREDGTPDVFRARS